MTTPAQAAKLDALIWRYGRVVLTTGFAASVLLVLAIATLAPDIILWIPLALLGATFMWWLFQKPLLNLCFVLGTFAFVAGFEEGIDPGEVLYAVYYITFLGVWFFRKVFLYREPVLVTTVDRLVVFIVSWVTLYTFVSPLFGTSMMDAVNELQSWTMLLFYFPVKDACKRYELGPKYILIVLGLAGLFIVFRNMYTLADKLAQATVAWQVTQKGRVIANETMMMVPAFGIVCLSFKLKRFATKLWLYGAFLTLMVGFVMTQGRGYWLAFAFGCLILLMVLDASSRIQLISLGLIGALGTVALLMLTFRSFALLLVAGLWNRLLSIGDAATADISLVNRFLEWRAVLANIAKNPIMGYGMARPFPYFDITIGMTEFRTWIHNGYLSVWYQFGIVGLISILTFYYHSIRTAFKVVRSRNVEKYAWAVATMALASLSATMVSTIPSNAWFNSDTLLYAGMLSGIACGTKERLDDQEAKPAGIR